MRLVLVLLRDPSSETCAAVVSVLETTTEKDDAPVEDFAQRGGRLGNAGDRSPEEVREMLRALGHRV